MFDAAAATAATTTTTTSWLLLLFAEDTKGTYNFLAILLAMKIWISS